MNQCSCVRCFAAVLFLGTFAGFAQTSASLLGASYAKPAPFLVAPGQVLTFFFRGVGPAPGGSLRSNDATGLPLRGSMAGLSLKIQHAGAASPLQVPILSVRQERECDTISFECFVTSVRVQIPYELAASTKPRLGPTGATVPDAALVLETDGQSSRTFALRPVSENGHVLTSCDLAGDTNPDSVCHRVAYHADGRPVNMDTPASLGETIVINAYGLGQTTPPAKTGEGADTGLSVLDPQQPVLIVTLQDQFLNSVDSLPRAYISDPYNLPWAKIDSAGLVPGQVGLYQVKVPIPTSFQIPVLCGPDPVVGSIRSNGLLQLTTAQGTENIPICVTP